MPTANRHHHGLPALLLLLCIAGPCALACGPREAVDGAVGTDLEPYDFSILTLVAPEHLVRAPGSPPPDPRLARVVEGLLRVSRTAEVAAITIDHPLDGSVFPPDMFPPVVLWHDSAKDADAWILEVAFAEGGPIRMVLAGPTPRAPPMDEGVAQLAGVTPRPSDYEATSHLWIPGAQTWETIRSRTRSAPATLTFLGVRSRLGNEVLSRGQVRLQISEDPVEAPILYRDLPLVPTAGEAGVLQPTDPDALPLILWHVRDLTRQDSRIVMQDMLTCASCHSFSQDGTTIGMALEGPKRGQGGYMISPIEREMVVEKDALISEDTFSGKPEGHSTTGSIASLSPDGTHVITTLNESLYVANFKDYRFLHAFFPTRGILAWYSTATGEMKALPGADDPAFVHTGGTWSPDGRTIVFSRARAFDPSVPEQEEATFAGDPKEPQIQYDLYRIPFEGGKGGTPELVVGASGNGKSNTFPRVSPDGKWIVFTKCENGQGLRPDGRLWIVPFEGGEAREMRCNTPLMNSWHSFSPNGRWMVFASKANSPYTQMFLTHIDEEGNDTPPIHVPHTTAANRAVNLPEFLNRDVESLLSIRIPAVSRSRHFDEGRLYLRRGQAYDAIQALRKAVQEAPDLLVARRMLAEVLTSTGDHVGARTELEYVLGVTPEDPALLVQLSHVLLQLDEADRSLELLEQAITVAGEEPGGALHLELHGRLLGRALHRAWAEDFSGAETDLVRAIEAAPDAPGAHLELSSVLFKAGRIADGADRLATYVRLAPGDVRERTRLAWIRAASPVEAARDGNEAVRLAEVACEMTGSKEPDPLDALAAAYAEAGRFDDAVSAAGKALAAARAVRNELLLPHIEARLAMYRAHEPYRTETD